ncbi:26271_t:CDS:2 [Dentiscutata erythropus]|uniref:26271_t:CDS:1 n=1 Tax=Dentiscutata erythropus TaxID=1348616 RepID=A0A9N9FWN7_9GLOM|nr:26271_t:CDS:2 [Dentiscutata erythropus]
MLYLLVQVNEGVKCVISECIMSIEPMSNQFFDLFDAITLGQYDDREVKVLVRQEKSEGWQEVDNGLNGDLKMLEVLGFMQVKFCLVPNTNLDVSDSTSNSQDAFSILMANSRQLLLPRRCSEHNNYNQLYNEIIELFQAQKVGWINDLHKTIKKIFVTCLASTLWYIDPYLTTLRARSCHLPDFFEQLKTYQEGKLYNEYYHTSHHKKNPLSQQKLTHLSSSLEISISQLWASNNIWNRVIPVVLSLIEILKKYSDYLNSTTVSMNELHHSNESARSPENNSTMYQVMACEYNKLKDQYVQLNNFLFTKLFYEHVDIQHYLPNDAIDRYRFMKVLQLTFLQEVNEGVKCVISECIMSIEPMSNQFFDLFDAITLGQYDDREVKVLVRQEKSEGWQEVDNGLNGDLKMLEVLGFMQVKFCLVPNTNLDVSDSTSNSQDAFSILMANSRQLLLPRRCSEHNNYNQLYNEIIELFQAQKVGWINDLHKTIKKIFVTCLASTLWYIDPYLTTLRARSCHLPDFFEQLKTYQEGKLYNEYYHTSHHKKNPLSQQKLTHLSSSLEISISQLWASNNIWNRVIPVVLSLIEILKKYSDYLNSTTVSMNELHHSNESARSPENNSTMYQVMACEYNKLKDQYVQLNNFLFTKPFYEHVNIQHYLPNDA